MAAVRVRSRDRRHRHPFSALRWAALVPVHGLWSALRILRRASREPRVRRRNALRGVRLDVAHGDTGVSVCRGAHWRERRWRRFATAARCAGRRRDEEHRREAKVRHRITITLLQTVAEAIHLSPTRASDWTKASVRPRCMTLASKRISSPSEHEPKKEAFML